MDMIVESNSFSTNEIININYCRIYLQVQNLSDITNEFGSLINDRALNHIKDPEKIFNWPFQLNPSKQVGNFFNLLIQFGAILNSENFISLFAFIL